MPCGPQAAHNTVDDFIRASKRVVTTREYASQMKVSVNDSHLLSYCIARRESLDPAHIQRKRITQRSEYRQSSGYVGLGVPLTGLTIVDFCG